MFMNSDYNISDCSVRVHLPPESERKVKRTKTQHHPNPPNWADKIAGTLIHGFLKGDEQVALSLSSRLWNQHFNEYQRTRKILTIRRGFNSNQLESSHSNPLGNIIKKTPNLEYLDITRAPKSFYSCQLFNTLSPLSRLHTLKLELMRGVNLPHDSSPTFLLGLTLLNNLQHLSVTGIEDTDLLNSPLPSQLHTLCIYWSVYASNITDRGFAQLTRLSSLSELTLVSAQFTDASLPGLSYLKNLKILNFNGNHNITDAGISVLTYLTQLYRLHLRGTSVSDNGLTALASLSELKHLDLALTRVSNAGLTSLSCLTKLTFLKLKLCPRVTNTGLTALSGLEFCKVSTNHFKGYITKEGFLDRFYNPISLNMDD